MNQSITYMRGSNAEILSAFIHNGWLNGEALARAELVVEENECLRRENALLNGRVRELRRAIREYGKNHVDALNYQWERQEGWRMSRGYRWATMFAAVGFAAALAASVMCIAAMP